MSATRLGKRKDPPALARQPQDDSAVQSITYWAGPTPIHSIKNSTELDDESNWVTHEWHPQNEVGVEDEPRWVHADAGEGLLASDMEDEWPLFVPPPPATAGRTADTKDHQSQHNSSTSSSTRRSKRVAESNRSTRTAQRRQGRPKRDQSDNDTDSRSAEGRESMCYRRSKRLRSNIGHENKKASSRIGKKYQVSSLPNQGSSHPLEPCAGNVVWDPVQAQEAIKRGEDIEAFLKKGEELPVRTLLMEALHNTGYNTSKAMSEFIKTSKHDKRLDHVTGEMSDAEHLELADLFHKQFKKDKDFAAIAKSTGYSMEKVLVQYYRWKGERREDCNWCKQQRLKAKESDFCAICDDGGTLIVCDLCKKSYHLKCLVPQLKIIPEGDWYCPRCILRSPAKVRTLCATGGTPKRSLEEQQTAKVKEARAKPTKLFTSSGDRGFSVTLPGATKSSAMSRKDKLRSIHKELDPKQLAKSSSRKGRSPVSSDYQVLCPVTSDGLLIRVNHTKSGTVVFNGYRRFPNGEMGPAEQKQLFGQPGDLLVAVDNKSIVSMTWNEAKKMLMEHNGKTQRLLSFQTGKGQMTLTTQPKNVPSDVTVSGCSPQLPVAQSATKPHVGQASAGHPPEDCNKATDPKKSGISTSPFLGQNSSGPNASQSNKLAVGQSQLASDINYRSESDGKSSSGGEEGKQTTDSIKSAADDDSTYKEEMNGSNGSISSDDDMLAITNAVKPAPAQVHNGTHLKVQPPCRGVQNPMAFQVPRASALGQGAVVGLGNNPRQAVRCTHSKNGGATTAPVAGSSARIGGAKSTAAGGGPGSFVPCQEAPVTNEKDMNHSSANAIQRSGEYDVKLTVTVEGLLVQVKEYHGTCVFDGYRKFKNGENSPASWTRPFRNLGDRIIGIDGDSVEQKCYEDIISILTNNNNKRFRALRMRERGEVK